jgi:hypothetical protein
MLSDVCFDHSVSFTNEVAHIASVVSFVLGILFHFETRYTYLTHPHMPSHMKYHFLCVPGCCFHSFNVFQCNSTLLS